MDRRTGTEQLKVLGEFIRAQRKQAALSMRDLAAMANVSNPYISQIERGLHEPSVRVLRSLAQALNMPVDSLLARAGLLPTEESANGQSDAATTRSVEAAIAGDKRLTAAQRDSLLLVYRNYLAAN